MNLIPALPAGHPPGGPAAGVLAAAHLLAAATIGQVIHNTTVDRGDPAGLATLFLTIGGVRYLMAGGDPAEVEKAKTAFKSAAIGYALAALAPVVVTVLKSLADG
jgi:type IV secretion system pilin